MVTFAVRRLLLLIPILFGLSILVFLFVRALPGGPEAALLGERATPERAAQVRAAYGFDQPLLVQYGKYLNQAVHLNLGVSTRYRTDVIDEITRRFPATIELGLSAIVFAIVVGIPLGYLAAQRRGTWLDNLSTVGSLLGIAIPVFVLGPLLKYVFAIKLGWLPSSGRQDTRMFFDAEHPTNFFVLDGLITGNLPAAWDAVKHLILPAAALGTIPLAFITRITRAAVLEVTGADFVRTAEAKGLTRAVVTRRHVLRNAMLPVVTIIGLQTGLLLSGAILTENVFAIQGMGQLMSGAIFDRDYAVLQGGILFLATVFILINLLVDLSYGLFDPRVRQTA